MAITPIVDTDPVSPLEDLFNTQATALEAEMATVTASLVYKSTADLTSLHAITATSGLTYVVVEGGAIFIGNGTVFVQITAATFASTSARDTAYAKASGAYRVTGALALDTSTGIKSRYNSTLTAWRLWDSDWITFTSTLTNITLGTGGTSTFKYQYQAGRVEVVGRIILGTSGFAVGTAPTFTLPVTAATPTHANMNYKASVSFFHASGPGNYPGFIVSSGTSTTVALFQAITGTPPASATVTSAVPFTWLTTDAFDVDLSYDLA